MTKKIISVLLILILSVSLITPAFAASFDTLINLEDNSASNSKYGSYAPVYDASTGKSSNFSYTVPDGGAAVLVFYIAGSDSDYSSQLFKSLSSSAWAKSSKLNFIAVEWGKANQSTVKTYSSKYDTNGVFNKSYYNAEANYLVTWYYNFVKNSGSMSNITAESITPCFVIYVSSQNGKKYIRYAHTAVNSASQVSDALSKFMDTSSLAGGGYDGYLNSGSAALSKLSKSEISQLLTKNPQKKPSSDDGYFDVKPVTSGSYKTGTVKTEYLQAATNRLSALRRIAGLPAVTMDATLNSQAQYGAVLLANSDFAHYPKQPSDMTDDFFNKGTAATSSSNLAAGRHLTETPDGFMKDEGTGNLPVMGHRRWQLNPTMAKVGFGFAVNSKNAYNSSNGTYQFKYYTDEKCWDTSGAAVDYKFISWPASGYFPYQIFDNDTAWSVTLSPSYYQTPDLTKVKVALTRQSDGKKWYFSNSEIYSVSDTGKYFTVETNGYGVANCIIFRPDANDIGSKYQGVYNVVISGLKDSFSNSVTLSYKVEFFNADDYKNVKSGFVKENDKTYYYTDGVKQTGWHKIDGKWYHFDGSGVMATKWQKISKKWYYFGADGVMRTKWQKISKKWYYLGTDGAMRTKWQKISKKWYYLGTDGAMVTKWQKISKKWYYFGTDGVMRTKWQKISKKWYYFGTDGAMLASTSQKIGKKTYKFDKNGVCLNP